MIAETLDKALRRAGIPIDGVSIGKTGDRRTWIVHLTPGASAQQEEQAAALVAGFDPVAPAEIDAVKDDVATSEADRPIVKALLLFFLRTTLKAEPTPTDLATAREGFMQALKDVS